MRWLPDEIRVRNYIEKDKDCPPILLIEHYIRCKRENSPVAEKVEFFVLNFLQKLVEKINQGLQPDYDGLLEIKRTRGRGAKRVSTRILEVFRLGYFVDKYMEEEGLTYENAIDRTAKKLGIGYETAKKMYTEYNKL